ncbi:MAG: type II toxin-antitoxin system RelE/ParE family toxin [Prochloron sp. SP5CPC1]|nr:type II toxin-antitoxin system RelE/ParE family toxin [Candidatus Paraprochloron terpiosi SP5CPC1]
MYEVVLHPDVLKFYADAQVATAKKIAGAFKQLSREPRNYPTIKSLKGTLAGYYRYRIGDYRIIYQIDDQAQKVFVDLIVHRGEAYK